MRGKYDREKENCFPQLSWRLMSSVTLSMNFREGKVLVKIGQRLTIRFETREFEAKINHFF